MSGEILGALSGGATAAAGANAGIGSILSGAAQGALGANPIYSALTGATGAGAGGNPIAAAMGQSGGIIPTVASIASGTNAATSPTQVGPVNPQGAQGIFSALRAQGFSPVQSVALMGNMQQESSLNPQAYNAKENAHGLIQWEGPRWTQLQQYANSNGLDPNAAGTQIAFLKNEMTGSQSGAAQEFLNATNVDQANAGLKKFIRYGDNSEGTRLKNANAFATQFGVGGSPSTPGGLGVTTTPGQTDPWANMRVAGGQSPLSTGGNGMGIPGSGMPIPNASATPPQPGAALKLANILKAAHQAGAGTPQAPQQMAQAQPGATDSSRRQALLAPAAQILAQLKQGTLPSPNLPTIVPGQTKSPVTI